MTDLEFNIKKGGNPAFAVKCFLQGLKFLKRKGLRQYLIMPLLINLLLYFSAFTVGVYYISELMREFIPSWLEWIEWILWPILFVSSLVIVFFTFTLLANLIASPFYGKLSAKTLSIVTGEPVPVDDQKLTQVLFAELKRWIYLITRALPLLLLFIIPGVNLIAPFLWLLFGAWGMILEFIAYPLENEGVLFPQQRQLVKSIRVGALSFGGLALLGLAIPILNVLIPPAAVIGATIYSHELKKSA